MKDDKESYDWMENARQQNVTGLGGKCKTTKKS